jgi:hypothetical protein
MAPVGAVVLARSGPTLDLPVPLTAHQARRWEPKRLRLRLFCTAGRLAVSGRATVLHLPLGAPLGRPARRRDQHPAPQCAEPEINTETRPSQATNERSGLTAWRDHHASLRRALK